MAEAGGGLRAVKQIRVLKYRYFRALDLRQWEAFGATLAEDATGSYGTKVYGDPLTLRGRAEIAGFMRKNVTGNMVTVHVASHPDIDVDVDGRAAHGSWLFEDTVIVPGNGVLIRGAGYYRDLYDRTEAGWLIAETSYERLFESVQSTADLPGFRLLANRWGNSGSPVGAEGSPAGPQRRVR